MRFLCFVTLAVALFTLTGCATIMGTGTGALTGMVDLPAQAYRLNKPAFENHPMLFGVTTVVLAPVGIVLGPVSGFFKGVSLDVQWVTGKVRCGDVFFSYNNASIWRPHTYYWLNKKQKAERAATLKEGGTPPTEVREL